MPYTLSVMKFCLYYFWNFHIYTISAQGSSLEFNSLWIKKLTISFLNIPLGYKCQKNERPPPSSFWVKKSCTLALMFHDESLIPGRLSTCLCGSPLPPVLSSVPRNMYTCLGWTKSRACIWGGQTKTWEL